MSTAPVELPMMANILGQPDSYQSVLQKHRADAGQVERCAKILREAHGRIILSGMGASLFAAHPAAIGWMQAGYDAQVLESADLLHYAFATLRKDDVGVLISRSGGSVEVLALAEQMRTAGMKVIAITNVPGSALEKAADESLHIGSFADQIVAVQTYGGTLLKLLLLVEAVCHPESTGLSDTLQPSLPMLKTFIDDCIAAGSGWQNVFDGSGAMYLLGRGTALATVQEGALLLHETAKASAIGMSCGQFRHGPVEAVDTNFRAIVFGAPPATRALDRALLRDLAEMGGTVRWIGPPVHDAATGLDLVAWPDVDARLAPIFEVVPLQVAAYRLAGWRGIVAGDFRYASEITSAESGFPRFQSRLAKA